MGRRKRLLRDSPGQIVFDLPNVVIRCDLRSRAADGEEPAGGSGGSVRKEKARNPLRAPGRRRLDR